MSVKSKMELFSTVVIVVVQALIWIIVGISILFSAGKIIMNKSANNNYATISDNQSDELDDTSTTNNYENYKNKRFVICLIVGIYLIPLAIALMYYTFIPKWINECSIYAFSLPVTGGHMVQSLSVSLIAIYILICITCYMSNINDTTLPCLFIIIFMSITAIGVIFMITGAQYGSDCGQYLYVFEVVGGILLAPLAITLLIFVGAILRCCAVNLI